VARLIYQPQNPEDTARVYAALDLLLAGPSRRAAGSGLVSKADACGSAGQSATCLSDNVAADGPDHSHERTAHPAEEACDGVDITQSVKHTTRGGSGNRASAVTSCASGSAASVDRRRQHTLTAADPLPEEAATHA
jgi:hypothetical protein